MTASSTASPRYRFASSSSWRSTRADSSSGLNFRPARVKVFSVPIQILKEAAVASGWDTSRSLAAAPTSTVPSWSTLTALLVLYSPSSLGISSALPSR